MVIWSDECSVERGSGKRRLWVFRTPEQKWDKEMIDPQKKGKNIVDMVWAAFHGNGKSELLFMPGDPEARRGGVSAAVYVETLDEALTVMYDPDLFFMQDNAGIHTARIMKDWFIENGICVIK